MVSCQLLQMRYNTTQESSIMTISFFGHAQIEVGLGLINALRSQIEKEYEPHCTFLCGGYGDFDQIATKILDEMRKEGEAFRKIIVVPYHDEGYLAKRKNLFMSYDEIIFPPLEKVPRKFAILRRNEWMVSQSDFIIFYVRHDWGGAARALSYAVSHKKNFVNIAEAL